MAGFVTELPEDQWIKELVHWENYGMFNSARKRPYPQMQWIGVAVPLTDHEILELLPLILLGENTLTLYLWVQQHGQAFRRCSRTQPLAL